MTTDRANNKKTNTVHLPLHYPAACLDCPGARLGTFQDLVGTTKQSCAFETTTVEARSFVPTAWTDRHAFGMVRRGVLIRQRIDRTGLATSIDAAGPGCVFPIERRTEPSESAACDYAATDLIVCLCPRSELDRALDETTTVGRQLLAQNQACLDRVERIAQARGAPTVKARVSALIRVLSDTLSPLRSREQLPPGLTQRDLARLAGVRHETFCRALGALERSGAIAREADGIRIVDRARLTEM